jgi:hypothetical protein
MGFWNRKAPKQQRIPLSKVIGELKEALDKNSELFNEFQAKRIESFFKPDGSPIVMKFQTRTDKFIEVPLVMLVNHKLLHLNELSITFTIPSDSVDVNALKKEYSDMGADAFALDFSKVRQGKEQMNMTLSFMRNIK